MLDSTLDPLIELVTFGMEYLQALARSLGADEDRCLVRLSMVEL